MTWRPILLWGRIQRPKVHAATFWIRPGVRMAVDEFSVGFDPVPRVLKEDRSRGHNMIPTYGILCPSLIVRTYYPCNADGGSHRVDLTVCQVEWAVCW